VSAFRHEESIVAEIESLRRISVRFLSQQLNLPRYIVEDRLNRLQVISNVLRDYIRWIKPDDEVDLGRGVNEEGSTG